MDTVQIYRLTDLRPSYRARLRHAQREAAHVWTLCCDLPLSARQHHTSWPTYDDFHQVTTGRFALHSQTVQAILRTFLGTIDATRERRENGARRTPRLRYPYQDKRFYPLIWPAQAMSRERGRIVLPMGRDRPSLVFPLDLPAHSGACTLVWRDGYELHVAVAADLAEAASGQAQATVDLGEIHQAAVTTNTGAALAIAGRGIRSLKRRHNMALGPDCEEAHTLPERLEALSQAARHPAQGECAQAAADPGPASQGHAAGRRLVPTARRGLPLHRQPRWRAQEAERSPPQPTDESMGVRPGPGLSGVQVEAGSHRALHRQ